jgi:phenylacetic acid degradation operon negative regulatory protein
MQVIPNSNQGMPKPANIGEFLQIRMARGQISSTSLIFTLFCDALTQHGGEVWLGSLIHALGPLGLSERLVRTAVFRLQQDGWLESRKIGRCSYYRPTATGNNLYAKAARRIYATGKPGWDGTWTLVIPALVAEEKKDLLRKSLFWQGFRLLSAGVYALPSSNRRSLNETLQEMNISDNVIVLSAREDEPATNGYLQSLVLERWNLDGLEQLYEDFVQNYRPALKMVQNKRLPDGQQCFLLRTLLIHEYRRILLRDPELPAPMLPANWTGFTAQSLTARIYQRIAKDSAHWLSNEMKNAKGKLPAASAEFFVRYT